MEVFAEGFSPREVQFAIIEQNPTLLNVTLFREANTQRLQSLTNTLTDENSEEIADKLDEGLELVEEEEESEDDDKIFGIIPNPLAKLQKDIKSNVDSFFSNIPLIGWINNQDICLLFIIAEIGPEMDFIKI